MYHLPALLQVPLQVFLPTIKGSGSNIVNFHQILVLLCKKKAVRVSSDSFLIRIEKLLFSNPECRIKIRILIERTYLFA